MDGSPLGGGTDKATISFATRINGDNTFDIIEKDRAHAHASKSAGHLGKHSTSANVTNGVVTYTAHVGVGSPATICMWIRARGPSDYRHRPD